MNSWLTAASKDATGTQFTSARTAVLVSGEQATRSHCVMLHVPKTAINCKHKRSPANTWSFGRYSSL
jgi:hypothetical protein